MAGNSNLVRLVGCRVLTPQSWPLLKSFLSLSSPFPSHLFMKSFYSKYIAELFYESNPRAIFSYVVHSSMEIFVQVCGMSVYLVLTCWGYSMFHLWNLSVMWVGTIYSHGKDWMFIPPSPHLPPRIHILKPNPQCSAVWEVTRSWGWSPHELDSCPYEKGPRELPCRLEDDHFWTRKGVLAKHQILQEPCSWTRASHN